MKNYDNLKSPSDEVLDLMKKKWNGILPSVTGESVPFISVGDIQKEMTR